MARTAHILLIDQLADWEPGYLLTELHTGRFTGEPWNIVGVAATTDPVQTMGGMRWVPEATLEDIDPAVSDLLILPGGMGWRPEVEAPYVQTAARFLDAGVPVAAICGATEALARAGLLDTRAHTSGAREVLAATGYAGGNLYLDQRAVAADGLVTAGPQSPVHFAQATLELLGLLSGDRLEAYEAVFYRGDPSGYATLMGS